MANTMLQFVLPAGGMRPGQVGSYLPSVAGYLIEQGYAIRVGGIDPHADTAEPDAEAEVTPVD